jgi:hypothetical protein
MGSRERSDTSSLRSFNDPAGFLSSASNGLSTACIVKTVSIPGKKKAQRAGWARTGTTAWCSPNWNNFLGKTSAAEPAKAPEFWPK